jgi:hypothetical protein
MPAPGAAISFTSLLLAVGLDDLRPAHSFGLCLPSDHPDDRLVEVHMLQLLRPRPTRFDGGRWHFSDAG